MCVAGCHDCVSTPVVAAVLDVAATEVKETWQWRWCSFSCEDDDKEEDINNNLMQIITQILKAYLNIII